MVRFPLTANTPHAWEYQKHQTVPLEWRPAAIRIPARHASDAPELKFFPISDGRLQKESWLLTALSQTRRALRMAQFTRTPAAGAYAPTLGTALTPVNSANHHVLATRSLWANPESLDKYSN